MKEYDLVIVGAGSGNMLPPEGFGDWKVAIVESDRMGGTCLNRGCIPSKGFVYTADIASHIAHSATYNIESRIESVDWPAIRDRIFARIDPLHQSALDYRRENGVDVYTDEAKFIGHKTLRIGGQAIRSERVVIASGSRPFIPDVEGLSEVAHHTSDGIMRIGALPKSMIVLGGGYIAAEMSHIFGSLGTQITVINRGKALLGSQDVDISEAFTSSARKRWDVRTGAVATRAEMRDGKVVVAIEDRSGSGEVEAELLLVATGRKPNTDRLDVAATGVELDEHGHVNADAFGRTNVEGVWTLGDVTNHFQLKHVANAQARVVWHNLTRLHEPQNLHKAALGVVPAAVFTNPQIASVGETEGQLIGRNATYVGLKKAYGDTAYGWAMEDESSFAKVLVDPATRLLLGAHIIGPQASILIQPLVQAMSLGNTVDELAHGVMYAHPALTEVVEQVLLEI